LLIIERFHCGEITAPNHSLQAAFALVPEKQRIISRTEFQMTPKEFSLQKTVKTYGWMHFIYSNFSGN
jgi:hypothetical protein